MTAWATAKPPLPTLRLLRRLLARRRAECGRFRCRQFERLDWVDEARAEVGIGAEPFGAPDEDAADLGGREPWIALEHERHDAADVGGRDRGPGRELIGVLWRRYQDVDPRRRYRDVSAAIGAGKELVVH